jgi:hypothetical protein
MTLCLKLVAGQFAATAAEDRREAEKARGTTG